MLADETHGFRSVVFGWDAIDADKPSDDMISKLFEAHGEFGPDHTCELGIYDTNQIKSYCSAHPLSWTPHTHLQTLTRMVPSGGLTIGIMSLPVTFHPSQGQQYGHHFYAFHQTHTCKSFYLWHSVN